MSGLKNECRLYPDRIEIISAGGLAGLMTADTLRKSRYSRNPKIMHALFMLGMVEESGQGITLMRRSLKKNGNPPPEFILMSDSFKVVFRASGSSSVTDRALDMYGKRILEYLETKSELIGRKEVEGLCKVAGTRAKAILKHMVQSGDLVKEGRGPKTRYRLP